MQHGAQRIDLVVSKKATLLLLVVSGGKENVLPEKRLAEEIPPAHEGQALLCVYGKTT
jgi:hypothetical protein